MRTILKLAVSLVAAGALVLSGVAWAQEATDETPVEDRPAYARVMNVLAPLIDDGTLTEAQAEAVAGALVEAIPERRCPGPRLRAIGRQTAEFLDITVAELRDALSEGATLAEVAEANGSDGEALIDHLVGFVEERLDEAVADERITAEEAADRLEQAVAHITALVNGDLPDGGSGPGFGPRRGGGGGPFGPFGWLDGGPPADDA